MKFIMYELFYRTMYLLLTAGLITCFTYFSIAIMYEYYAAYFANYYEATEFAFDQSTCEFRNCVCCFSFWPCSSSLNAYYDCDLAPPKESFREKESLSEKAIQVFFTSLPVAIHRSCLKQHYYFINSQLSFWSQGLNSLTNESCNDVQGSNINGITENNDAKAWSFLFISSMAYFFPLQLNVQRLNYILTNDFCCYLTLIFNVQFHGFVIPGLLTAKRLHWLTLLHLLIIVLLTNYGFYLFYLSFVMQHALEQLDSELQMMLNINF